MYIPSNKPTPLTGNHSNSWGGWEVFARICPIYILEYIGFIPFMNHWSPKNKPFAHTSNQPTELPTSQSEVGGFSPPIWNTWSSNWIISLQKRGEIKNVWNHHLDKIWANWIFSNFSGWKFQKNSWNFHLAIKTYLYGISRSWMI